MREITMTVTAPPAATAAGATAVVKYRDLLAALATVAAVLDRKSRPPWYAALVTGSPDGDLTVTGASYAATVSVRLPGVAQSPGRFMVDGWALTRMCKALVRGERRRDTDDLPVLLDGSFPAAPTVTTATAPTPTTAVPFPGAPTSPERISHIPAPGVLSRPNTERNVIPVIYLSRRRRRRARFWVFVLLLVWLLGVAAAHDVAMLVAHAAVALVAVTVDLTAGARRRGRRRLPPRRTRRHRTGAAARSGAGSRPARRARPAPTSAHRPGTAT
jgi:hypothetical protein